MADLLGAKLRALVKGKWGDGDREQADFPGGAALVAGSTGWLLLEPNPVTALGAALVWAERRRLKKVHLLVEADAGLVARRAALFAAAPTVWRIHGTVLAPAAPDLPRAVLDAPPAPELAELLVDADLEVFVEDGIVRGELLGLEVARIVHGTTTAGTPIDAPVLEVGVGHADREMTAMLHAGLAPTDQLARVIDIVRQHRRPGAEPHPLNQLAPERWLRAVVLADPSRIGLRELHHAEPAVPRPNLRDTAVAISTGVDREGVPVVVGFAVGVLLDFVPAAADARFSFDSAREDGQHHVELELRQSEVLLSDPDLLDDTERFDMLARRYGELEQIVGHFTDRSTGLLLVTPERDALPVTQALAARLVRPADLIPIEGDWRG